MEPKKRRRDWSWVYHVIVVVVGLGILSVVGYAGWRIERGCNYSFGYDEKVQETVRAMVKPECLKCLRLEVPRRVVRGSGGFGRLPRQLGQDLQARCALRGAKGRDKPMSDNFELLRGDCIAGMVLLVDKSADLVITDPPYGQHVHERQRSGTMNRAEGGPGMPLRRLRHGDISRERPIEFAHLTAEVRLAVCQQFARLVRRWVLIFADPEGIHGWKTDLEACGLE